MQRRPQHPFTCPICGRVFPSGPGSHMWRIHAKTYATLPEPVPETYSRTVRVDLGDFYGEVTVRGRVTQRRLGILVKALEVSTGMEALRYL